MYTDSLSAIAAALLADAVRAHEPQRLTYREARHVPGECQLHAHPGQPYTRQITRTYSPDAHGCIESDTYLPGIDWEVL